MMKITKKKLYGAEMCNAMEKVDATKALFDALYPLFATTNWSNHFLLSPKDHVNYSTARHIYIYIYIYIYILCKIPQNLPLQPVSSKGNVQVDLCSVYMSLCTLVFWKQIRL